MRILAIFLVLLASCCVENKKKNNRAEVEKIEVMASIDGVKAKLPIYCASSIRYQEHLGEYYYMVENSFTVNLPQGYYLKYIGDDEHYFMREGENRYSNNIASTEYPNKVYKHFAIKNVNDKTINIEVDLPVFEFKQKR